MRVGIIALLHESNTFVTGTTDVARFGEDVLLTGEPVREHFRNAPHEIGGFFSGLADAGIEAVPLFAARAFPSGRITANAFDALLTQLLEAVDQALPLDGVLAAPHGATVAINHADADGYWLSLLRQLVGPDVPIVATLDAHANLSPRMVNATNALVAYRTNPHLDQHETGVRAARIMAQTLAGEITPTQAAAFPPLAINIQSQNTAIPPMAPLMQRAASDEQADDVLAQNILLGFPYADVAEMGTSVVTLTNNNPERAQELADALARDIWQARHEFEPTFISVKAALDDVAHTSDRVVLLDMGDNIGGGSPADGTALLQGLDDRKITPSLVCIHDPMSVQRVAAGGIGWSVNLSIGGRGDRHQGRPLQAEVEVMGLYDGQFRETSTRHGGFTEFDQGRSAVVRTARGVTVLLTSRRVPPFSLAQLTSCDLDPTRYRVIVAKGVIAPQAAYREVCDRMILVNTPGVTCADMTQLEYTHRRRPMFPFESETDWP